MKNEEAAYKALRDINFSFRFKELADRHNDSKGSSLKIKKSGSTGFSVEKLKLESFVKWKKE
jgi:hypothetical protein